MADIFSIGVSGLNAAQAGLATTSHNISNASTPGYSRQEIVQTAAAPQLTGGGFFGQGVQVSTVKRIYSNFLASQVTQAQTQSSQLDSYYAQISQIDNLLGNSSAGLAPALNDFFSGVQAVAANPADVPSRQALLSSAGTLVSNFQSLDQQLEQIRDGVNSQIASSVSAINGFAQQIASLNQSVAQAQAGGAGQPPNDLLDQRDQLVTELSQQVQATVVKQSDGSYDVFVGNGQPLVLGDQGYSLSAVPSPADPQDTAVACDAGGSSVPLADSSLQGGPLGGLLAFRDETLDATQNALGRIAIGLGQAFNAQHALGQDLNGALGGAFFTVPGPAVLPSSANAGSASVSATVADASALTTSDYQLRYNGASGGNESYTLTRLSDGATMALSFPSAGGYPYSTTVDGVALTIGAGAAQNDSWKIEPTRDGASGIGVAITDPAKIAAASPISTAASLRNQGDATISAGNVSSAAGLPLTGTITLTYSAAGNQLIVSGPVSAGPFTYASGSTVSFNGISFAISGTPADGDTFTVQPNTGGVADNRNALALAALQTASTLGRDTGVAGSTPTLSFTGAYAALAAQIGDKTSAVQVQQSAQQSLLAQTQQAQQSVSGVNLDEEAANLLRYQQAYQAAGKMLQIASTLFQSILAIGS